MLRKALRDDLLRKRFAMTNSYRSNLALSNAKEPQDFVLQLFLRRGRDSLLRKALRDDELYEFSSRLPKTKKNQAKRLILFILAERTRFELVVAIAHYVGLANRWFQPLTHLSGLCSELCARRRFVIRGANLDVFFVLCKFFCG